MQTRSDSVVTPERIMQFSFAYASTFIIETALNFKVFDILDNGPKTVDSMAVETGASVRGLNAIMNALVGLSLLSKDHAGLFSLTPESSTFLISTKPGYFGGFFRHSSEQLIPKWLKLEEAVKAGKPPQPVNQESAGADFFREFVADLFPVNYPAATVLAQTLNVSQVRERYAVLDVASGSGVWGIALAQNSPVVEVTALDWPEVLEVTQGMVAKFGLMDRFTFLEGDLQDVEFGGGYRLAILGHIIHTEGEAAARNLLAKSFDALEPGGEIAIAEFLVNEDRTGPTQSLIFAVNMLVNTDRGDTYSFGEISDWLKEAGFENARLVDAPGPSPLILATKPKE